jgi:hypothetical protein
LKLEGYGQVFPINRWLPLGAQAICAVKDRTAYLAFRGSSSWLDWYVNLLMVPIPWPMRHFGFAMGWWSLRGAVLAWLNRHREHYNKVALTGHSLGGALAFQAAYQVSSEYPIDRVVTFGAARPFWISSQPYNTAPIAESEQTLGDLTLCFVNHSDIVPNLPPWVLGYVEVGKLIYITAGHQVLTGIEAWKQRTADDFGRWDRLLALSDPGRVSGPFLSPYQGLSSPSPGSESTQEKLTRWWETAKNFCKMALPALWHLLSFPLMYFKLIMTLISQGMDHKGAGYSSSLGLYPSESRSRREYSLSDRIFRSADVALLIVFVALPLALAGGWAGWQIVLLMADALSR